MPTENLKLTKYTISFGVALAIASVANALLVIAKELSPSHVQVWMKKLTGHHWTAQCALVLGIFLALGWLFSRFNGGKGLNLSANALILTVVGGVVIGSFTIAVFYLVAG